MDAHLLRQVHTCIFKSVDLDFKKLMILILVLRKKMTPILRSHPGLHTCHLQVQL